MKVRLHGDQPSERSRTDSEARARARHPSRPESIAGLRRVDWVRILVDEAGNFLSAKVEGVGYRLPVTVPVPRQVATDLIVAGTPWVKCHAQ